MSISRSIAVELDLCEAGAVENAPHAGLIGERERARVLRAESRAGAERNATRLCSGVICQVLSLAARQQAKTARPPRLSAPAQIGEGADGIGEEHHAEARDERVERRRRKDMGRGVGKDEFDRQSVRRATARSFQHRLRDVEADRAPGWADAAGDIDRRAAAAATDVEDTLARGELGAFEQRLGDRREDDVLLGVEVEPASRGDAVPVGDLLGVGGGVRRHILPFSGAFSSWRSCPNAKAITSAAAAQAATAARPQANDPVASLIQPMTNGPK